MNSNRGWSSEINVGRRCLSHYSRHPTMSVTVLCQRHKTATTYVSEVCVGEVRCCWMSGTPVCAGHWIVGSGD